MKRLSILINLIFFITSAVPSPGQAQAKFGKRYEYELLATTDVYSLTGPRRARLTTLPVGTRVTTFGPAQPGDYRLVNYNGYDLLLYKPDWYATRTYKGAQTYAHKPVVAFVPYVALADTQNTLASVATRSNLNPLLTGAEQYMGPRSGHYYIASNGTRTALKLSTISGSRRK